MGTKIAKRKADVAETIRKFLRAKARAKKLYDRADAHLAQIAKIIKVGEEIPLTDDGKKAVLVDNWAGKSNSPDLVGKTALFSGFKEPIVFSNHFLRIRIDSEAADPGYVARWLSFQWRCRKFENLCTRWVNQASVRKDDLLDLQMSLPELSEQQRIAGRLEQADRLRRTRSYALELTNTFLPAAFLELFGDPVANPRSWERARVCELGDVETGNTPPRETADYYGSAIEWIKSDNISLAQMQPSKATEGLSEKGIEVGRIVETGSLLLTCIAGSKTSIGNVVLTDRRVAFNQQINAVTPHRDVDPQFLYGLFLTSKPMIQRNTTLAMERIITKGKLFSILRTLQLKFPVRLSHNAASAPSPGVPNRLPVLAHLALPLP